MGKQNVNIELFRELFIKYIFRDKFGIKSKKANIISDYEDETGYMLSSGQYDHYKKSLDVQECWEESRGTLPIRSQDDFGVDRTQQEGLYYSERYIELSTEKKATPTEIMLSHGYDPKEWRVVGSKSTGSKIGTKGNDEQYFINTYKTIQVVPVKPEELTREELVELMKENIEPISQIEFKSKVDSGKAFVAEFFDIHVGSDGYDRLKIIERVQKMKYYIQNNKIEKVYIVFGGDFLHVSSSKEQTVAGTQLKLVGSAYDMIREGELLARYIIENLATVRSEVFWVLGNHSDLPEFQLFDKLAHLFSKNEHIKFHTDESPYKAFVYGVQFILVSHGNIGIKELQTIPSQRFPKLWAKAKAWEVHLGHIHHEHVKLFGNLVVRYQRTPKSTDSYEYYKGWYNNLNHIQAYTIDLLEGITGVHYF